MKKLHILLLLVLCGAANCSTGNYDQELKLKTEQSLARAEELLVSRPEQAMEVLEGMPEVDALDNALLQRWCMAYGKAANELRRNELLPQARFQQVFDQYEENGVSKDQAWITFFIGNVRLEQKKEEGAMELYLNALYAADLLGENKLGGDVGSTMGWLYWSNRNYAMAQVKYKQALGYYQQDGFILGQVRTLSNIGHVLVEQDSLPNALAYAKSADELATNEGDRLMMGIAASLYARIYRQQGDYTLAEEYGLKGIQLDVINTAPHYVALSKTYLLEAKFDRASWCLDQAETAPSLNRYTPRTIALYRAELAEVQGRTEDGLRYRARYQALRDSLSLSATAQQLSGAEARINRLKADKVTLLQRIDLKETIIHCIILFMLVAGGLTWYLFKRIQQRELKKAIAYNKECLEQIALHQQVMDDIERSTTEQMAMLERMHPTEAREWSRIYDEESQRHLQGLMKRSGIENSGNDSHTI